MVNIVAVSSQSAQPPKLIPNTLILENWDPQVSNSISSPVSLAVTSSQLSGPGSHSWVYLLPSTATSTITPYHYGPTSTTDCHRGHFPATCQASRGSQPPIGPRQQLALPASTNQEQACRPHNGPAEAIVYRCLMKLWSSGNFRVRELCSAKRGRYFPIWGEEGRSGRRDQVSSS